MGTVTLFRYLQKATMKQAGCDDCPIAVKDEQPWNAGDVPELCKHKGNNAFYCPITGRRLGWTNELLKYYVEGEEDG